MTQRELEYLVQKISAEIKKDCAGCPLAGISQPQASAMVELAEGYVSGKKTAWKAIITLLATGGIALITWGVVYRIAELLKK